MGSSLTTPLLSCCARGDDGQHITYGGISCNGGRGNSDGGDMEDRKVCDERSKDGTKRAFGVFDGHGGSVVADDLAHYLPTRILESDLSAKQIEDVCLELDSVYCAIRESGMDLDRIGTPPSRLAWRQQWRKRQAATSRPIFTVENQKLAPSSDPGSTATMLVADISKSEITIIQVGDSRCVIVSEEKGKNKLVWKQPLKDHETSDENEKKRVESAGWHIRDGRVGGDLAMTRAFGNGIYKKTKGKTQREQAVVAVPDIVTVALQQNELVMIFTDGVQERNHDNDKLVEILQSEMSSLNKTIETLTSQDMVDLAQRLCYLSATTSEFNGKNDPSGDNMTIIFLKMSPSETLKALPSPSKPWCDYYPVWHLFPKVQLNDAKLYRYVNADLVSPLAKRMAKRFGENLTILAETPFQLFLRARLSQRGFLDPPRGCEASLRQINRHESVDQDILMGKEIEDVINNQKVEKKRLADFVEAKRVERATALPDVKEMKSMNGEEIRKVLRGYTVSELIVFAAETSWKPENREQVDIYRSKAQHAILRMFRDGAGDYENASIDVRCASLLKCWNDTFRPLGNCVVSGTGLITPLPIINTLVTIVHENSPPTMEHLNMLQKSITGLGLRDSDWIRWITNIGNFEFYYYGAGKSQSPKPWRELLIE